MRVLGMETTCDETAAAVVRLRPDGGGEILADEVMSQIAAHAAFGGVVPEIAARAHVEVIDELIGRALGESEAARQATSTGSPRRRVPASSAACWSGLMTGKGVALATGKPFIAVNHLEAHALMPRLDRAARLSLSAAARLGRPHPDPRGARASANTIGSARRWTTPSARLSTRRPNCSGSPYPGGPRSRRRRKRGDPDRFALPRPMLGRPNADFSLSGLKTAVRHARRCQSPRRCAAGRRRSLRLVSGGGGGRDRGSDAGGARPVPQAAAAPRRRWCSPAGSRANAAIRANAARFCAQSGMPMIAPPPKLCTDNGAMIAWAGIEKLRLGLIDDLAAPARPRWPLDPKAERARNNKA